MPDLFGIKGVASFAEEERAHWRYEPGGFNRPPGGREEDLSQAHVRTMISRHDARNEAHQSLPFEPLEAKTLRLIR